MVGLGPTIHPTACSPLADCWILGTLGTSPSAGKPEDDRGKQLFVVLLHGYGRASKGLMVFTPNGLKWRSFLVRRTRS